MQPHLPRFSKFSISTGAAILPSTKNKFNFWAHEQLTHHLHVLWRHKPLSTLPKKKHPKTALDAINYMKEINRATVTIARPPNLQVS